MHLGQCFNGWKHGFPHFLQRPFGIRNFPLNFAAQELLQNLYLILFSNGITDEHSRHLFGFLAYSSRRWSFCRSYVPFSIALIELSLAASAFVMIVIVYHGLRTHRRQCLQCESFGPTSTALGLATIVPIRDGLERNSGLEPKSQPYQGRVLAICTNRANSLSHTSNLPSNQSINKPSTGGPLLPYF